MSEVETFNVKNISLRLVHIGGIEIPPNKVVALVNDPMGINKADVDSSEYLEQTDAGANWGITAEEVEALKPKQLKAQTSAKSATGAGWSKQP